MPKINHEEYELLKEYLIDGFKWMARDSDLAIYDKKPIKRTAWTKESEMNYISKDYLFQFIQWEDEEPHNIAELIEEYEDSKEYKDSLVIEYFLDKAKRKRGNRSEDV